MSDVRQPQVDFFHSWAVILPFGQQYKIDSIRAYKRGEGLTSAGLRASIRDVCAEAP